MGLLNLHCSWLLQELDSSEKQWVEVCGQIDKLDKFFPLSSLPLTKARQAQQAAVARGSYLTKPLESCCYVQCFAHIVTTVT